MQEQFRKVITISSFAPILIVGILVLVLIVGVYLGPLETIMSGMGGP